MRADRLTSTGPEAFRDYAMVGLQSIGNKIAVSE